MIDFTEGIQEYAIKHSDREASILYDLTEATRDAVKGPAKISGHIVGTFLRMLVQITNSKSILEIGTFSGYSSLAMAMGLPEDGKLVTLDNNKEMAALAREYWDRTHLGKLIELKLGDVVETLKEVEGPFDMAFIGGTKNDYVDYWDAAVEKVKSGGIIVVDNVLLSGTVLNPKDEMAKTIDAFNEHVRYDQRVQRLMLTLHDGLTLARKF